MTDHTHRRRPWRPRICLWHLFAITALAAVPAWLWPRWGVESRRVPGQGSRLIVLWEGDRTTVWDTFEHTARTRASQIIVTSGQPGGRTLDQPGRSLGRVYLADRQLRSVEKLVD